MSKLAFLIDLAGWPCLVAGGSSEAARRTESLLDAGALVTCWHSEFVESFGKLANLYPAQLSFVRGELSRPLLEHLLRGEHAPKLLLIDTGREELDQELYQLCESLGVLASLPGQSARLDFARLIPRAALNFAVSAEEAPELEHMLALKLEHEISKEWSEGSCALVDWLQSENVQNRHPDIMAPIIHELSTALIESEGRYKTAKLRAERKLGREI